MVGPLLFILSSMILVVSPKISSIKYANDTVIYSTGKEVKEINTKLSNTAAEL